VIASKGGGGEGKERERPGHFMPTERGGEIRLCTGGGLFAADTRVYLQVRSSGESVRVLCPQPLWGVGDYVELLRELM